MTHRGVIRPGRGRKTMKDNKPTLSRWFPMLRMNAAGKSPWPGVVMLGGLMALPLTAQAGLEGDGWWRVERGDNTYSIARKVYPDDKAKRRAFRKALIEHNPEAFRNGPGQLEVGVRLSLPGLAASPAQASSPRPAQAPAASAATATPAAAAVAPAPATSAMPAASATDTTDNSKVEAGSAAGAVASDGRSDDSVVADPQEVIGHVIISVGEMEADNRGAVRPLKRHSPILRGDTLITSENSYTQIRMKDGALLSLRPKTRLQIKEYAFNGKEDGTERSFMDLLSGGLRTITGYIGHRNKQNYRVRTPVATIGIRGTHYGLLVCSDGACQDNDEPLDDGVYGGVVDGSIEVSNDSGSHVFNNDQFFYVASNTQSPVETLAPPPIFHGKADRLAGRQGGEAGGNGNGNESQGGKRRANLAARLKAGKRLIRNGKVKGDRLGALVQAYVDDSRPPVLLRDQKNNAIKDLPTADVLEVKAAPKGSVTLVSGTTIDSVSNALGAYAEAVPVLGGANKVLLGQKVETGGKVIGNLPVLVHQENAGSSHTLLLPSANAVIDTGGGSSTSLGFGVNWGRWSGNYLLTENGASRPALNDMHFIYSDHLTSPQELQALGGLTVVNYGLVGGTTPTSLSGAPVKLQDIQVSADFVNQVLTSYGMLIGTGPNSSKFLTMPPNVNAVPFNRMDNIPLEESAGTMTGKAAAAFVGPHAEGMITTYGITNGKDTINGAALLQQTTQPAF